MTTEEILREMILNRYHSIREFSTRIDLPNSTVESMLKRGVQNSTVSNVIKMCKELNISVEALAEGRIEKLAPGEVRVITYTEPSEPQTELTKVLEDAITRLKKTPGITLNGKSVKNKDVDSIVDAMRFGVTMVTKRQSEED